MRSEDAKQMARELVRVWREVGATWGEVAAMMDKADRRLQEEGNAQSLVQAASQSVAQARDEASRLQFAEDLCAALRGHIAAEDDRDAGQSLSRLLALSRELGATLPGDLSQSALAAAWVQLEDAEARLRTGLPAEARRAAVSALKLLREEHRGPDQHIVCRKGEAVALLVLARAALALPSGGKETEAFSAAMDALTLYRQVGDRKGEAEALHALAETCLSMGAPGASQKAALQLCSEAGRLFCDVEERLGVAKLLGTMSRLHLALGSPEEAQAAARDSLATFREVEGNTQSEERVSSTPFKLDEAASLLSLVSAQLAAGKAAESETTASQCVELVRGQLSRDDIGEGLKTRLNIIEDKASLALLQARLACGQTEQVLEAGTKALEKFRSAGDIAAQAAVLKILASAHLSNKAPSAARAAARQALQILQDIGDTDGEKEALQLVVSSELMGSDSGSAMQTAKLAVERFKSEGDRRNEALALQTVAKTHIVKQEFLRAARVAKDAQAILSELGDIDAEIDMLRTAVDAHLARPEKDGKEDAMHTAMEAMSHFQRTDNLKGQALTLSILAKIYLAIQDPESAVNIVRDAVAMFRELGDRRGETNVVSSIINADLIPTALEKSDLALRAVKAALAVCDQAEDKRGQAVMLKTTFRILLAREKPERALQAADEAIKVFREVEDRLGEAEMLRLMAHVLLNREEHRRALVAAQSAASLFRETGDRAGEMSSLQLAMDVHAARGDHALAIEASGELLSVCRSLNDPGSEATLLHRMCEVYLEQGGKENAEMVASTAKQAHSLARAAGDLGAETSALSALAKSHLAANRPKEAIEVAREAVRCANDSGDRQSQIVGLQAYADVSAKLGHAFDAIEASAEVMEYARLEGNVLQETAALTTLVESRLANAEPSEALRVAKETHDRSKRLGNIRAEAASLQAVASVCLHIRAPAEAITALDAAQEHYKKLKDRKREATVLGMAVKAHLLTGDGKEALRAAKEARGMFREVRDKKGEAEVLKAAAQVHSSKGDYNDALDAAKSMASIYEELGDVRASADARMMVASLYLTRGDVRSGVDAGEDAVRSFQKAEDLSGEAAAQQLCAQAYLRRHEEEERSRAARGMQNRVVAQGAQEAVRAGLRARALYKQLGNTTGEMDVLDNLGRSLIAKHDAREALHVAADYVALAKKARDKVAEANANLICSSALANDGQLSQAMRSAEIASSMFKEVGHNDGLRESERFLTVLREAMPQRASGYGARNGATGRFGFGGQPREAVEDSGGGPTRQSNTGIYNRKAFPWTPSQGKTAEAGGPQSRPGI
eukprot:TRINITY_DN18811_c0_g2_i1.p1 TRINITY_DN18811_c0_g2~~TRINITY_DN18811_c0_g2_i1.p1  ORF type:complete len:1386 (+),score=330.47 TRINITY_DN18811_c0_g2_i1:236-4159(+)